MSEIASSRLGDVTTIVMGQSPSGDACNRDGEGPPLLNGPTEFGPTHPYAAQWTTDPTKWAEVGDTLFCVRGSTTGKMNRADQRYVVGRGIAAIRGSSPADTRFAFYAIHSRLPGLLQRATGSTFPNVSGEMLRDLEVPWPEASDRARIAGVLGALDDLVEVNRGLMRDLDQLGMSLFKSAWDGDSWTTVSSLGQVTMGQSPPGSTYNEQGLGTVFFQGVRDFGDRYPQSRVHCTAPTRVADAGDILIAVRAPIGETNVAIERTAIGRGLGALHAAQPALALRALRASEKTWAAHQGTGTVFSSISGPDLRQAQVPDVSDATLESQLRTLDAMHLALAQENAEVTATRDELLPLLMSGRVRVSEELAA